MPIKGKEGDTLSARYFIATVTLTKLLVDLLVILRTTLTIQHGFTGTKHKNKQEKRGASFPAGKYSINKCAPDK